MNSLRRSSPTLPAMNSVMHSTTVKPANADSFNDIESAEDKFDTKLPSAPGDSPCLSIQQLHLSAPQLPAGATDTTLCDLPKLITPNFSLDFAPLNGCVNEIGSVEAFYEQMEGLVSEARKSTAYNRLSYVHEFVRHYEAKVGSKQTVEAAFANYDYQGMINELFQNTRTGTCGQLANGFIAALNNSSLHAELVAAYGQLGWHHTCALVPFKGQNKCREMETGYFLLDGAILVSPVRLSDKHPKATVDNRVYKLLNSPERGHYIEVEYEKNGEIMVDIMNLQRIVNPRPVAGYFMLQKALNPNFVRRDENGRRSYSLVVDVKTQMVVYRDYVNDKLRELPFEDVLLEAKNCRDWTVGVFSDGLVAGLPKISLKDLKDQIELLIRHQNYLQKLAAIGSLATPPA